jgi:hypothetical protein
MGLGCLCRRVPSVPIVYRPQEPRPRGYTGTGPKSFDKTSPAPYKSILETRFNDLFSGFLNLGTNGRVWWVGHTLIIRRKWLGLDL